MRGLWQKWKKFATIVGNFNARLLLTLFYFTLLVPFAVLRKLASDTLRMRKHYRTQWIEIPPEEEGMEKQF